MRALVQLVKQAKVEVGGNTIGEIPKGLLVLLGVTHEDNQSDIEWLVKKITQLRIFKDEGGKMNLSIKDIGGDILIISQFTLFANCKKGNRPSYIRSAPPSVAIPLYEQFITTLKGAFSGKVETGEFGAYMQVSLLNDGPVTILLDSKQPAF